MSSGNSTRGILRPQLGFEHFELDRIEPPEDLRKVASGLWTVRWDLPEGQTFEQEILPFPNVNLAFEEGHLRVHGPSKERFVGRLTGKGWVAGMRFRPAGFFAVSGLPMSEIVDHVWPAHEALTCASPAFPPSPEEARRVLVDHVRVCLRRSLDGAKAIDLEELARVSEWVERAEADRRIATATDLAKIAGVSLRTLHRFLQKYVGVSTKWIVRRARIQEGAQRVARGESVNWAEVAQALGYHDQAHLIRDFKRQLGVTPAAYAEECAKQRARK